VAVLHEILTSIQKRMNARLDYGIANDASAFYISFNEAF
jgi:hypothetical protein